jgi:hypothetical protein
MKTPSCIQLVPVISYVKFLIYVYITKHYYREQKIIFEIVTDLHAFSPSE